MIDKIAMIEDIPHDALLVLHPYSSSDGSIVAVFATDLDSIMSTLQPLGNILVTDEELLLLNLSHKFFESAGDLIAYTRKNS